MLSNFYKRFVIENLTLQEHLAIHRTLLANERTFLAYIRTALALFIAGASLIRFFDDPLAHIAGIALIPFGLILFVIGTVRYHYMKREISNLQKEDPIGGLDSD